MMAEDTQSAPTRLGRYQIVRRIGKSMTDVYLAIDTVENRKAALKLIKADGDSATQRVLEAERRGATIQQELRLVDPRVVEVYEFGDLDGYFFVAMQYIEGRNLAEVLQAERALDPARAATIALEICEQLAKFHSWQAAVVHGDIKPSNIHLGPNDTVRLLDFGIAKTLRAGCDATVHDFGSPGYCSPERLARSEVDQQSDLWAVGATLYEMLVGAPPYQAEDTRKLEALIRSRRPPRALPASCPRTLRTIAAKALAPNPSRRYATAREFQADLQAFLEHKPAVAEMERRPARIAAVTIEAARDCLRRATRTVRKARPGLRVAGAVAWFAAGMSLWIVGAYAWQTWQAWSAVHAAPPPAMVPAALPKDALPVLYLAEADRVFEAYRASANQSLHDFDWQKAEVCLEHAVALGSANDRTLGKLALARGYGALERLNGEPYSDQAAAQLRLKARNQFSLAAGKLPNDPAAHLALARVYVYSLPSVDKAMAEFAAAGLLGAVLGKREIEQQADAYRIRAEQEAEKSPEAAWQDAQVARGLYQQVAGFDRADEHLRALAGIHDPAVKNAKLRRSRRWR